MSMEKAPFKIQHSFVIQTLSKLKQQEDFSNLTKVTHKTIQRHPRSRPKHWARAFARTASPGQRAGAPDAH